MRYRADKKRFLILAGVVLALLAVLVQRATFSPGWWLQVLVLLVASGLLLLWLSRFGITIDNERVCYCSLFSGEVCFSDGEIKTIRHNKYDELTHLLYSRHTLFVHLITGRDLQINVSIFPAEVAKRLAERGWPVRK